MFYNIENGNRHFGIEEVFMEFRKIDVSVIVPVYMEEAYIENCIKSLIEQEFPREKMEWIFVDGGSTDRTRDILKRYQKEYP